MRIKSKHKSVFGIAMVMGASFLSLGAKCDTQNTSATKRYSDNAGSVSRDYYEQSNRGVSTFIGSFKERGKSWRNRN